MWYILETIQQSYDLCHRLIRAISHRQLGGNDDIADLLQRGAEVNKLHGTLLPLHCACMIGDVAVITLLLQYGAQVNAVDGYSRTALHYAAESDKTACVERLIGAGVDVNAPDGNGDTALHWSAYRGAYHCLSMLLQNGASVDRVDSNNATPLLWASKSPSAASIVVLLRHNASPYHVDASGRAALIYAALSTKGAERDASIILIMRACGHLDTLLRQANLPPGDALDRLSPYIGECQSLRQLCRYTIRSCLGECYLPNIVPLLPLPTRLHEYLLLQH